jgi:hypothetical protein
MVEIVLRCPGDLVRREGTDLSARRIFRCGLAVITSLVVGAVPRVASAATTPPGQIITVGASSVRSVVGIVRVWELEIEGQYVQVMGPIHAQVGVHGVGPTREGAGDAPHEECLTFGIALLI